MSNEFICLGKGELKLVLCRPGTYYQGTRFDWSGIFRKVELGSFPYCDEWFDDKDSRTHDRVCGPSEEFTGFVGYDEAPVGGAFLKIGVGLLRREDEGAPQRFHTYEILDPGRRTLTADEQKAVFCHEMPGIYEYSKTVEIIDGKSFRIIHNMKNTGTSPIATSQYNHNFFTFGLPGVGTERSVEWKSPIEALWREDSVNGRQDGRSILVTDTMHPGQTLFVKTLRCIDGQSAGAYGFTLRAGDRSVSVRASLPMTDSVLWANDRVFCPEPYVNIRLAPGESTVWWIEYTLG